MVKFQVFGTSEVTIRLKQIDDDIKSKVLGILNNAVDNCQSAAFYAAPVDTGFLHDNIVAHPATTPAEQMEGTVTADASYSLFIEAGHKTRSGSFVKPQPFLFPSFRQSAKVMIDDCRDVAG